MNELLLGAKNAPPLGAKNAPLTYRAGFLALWNNMVRMQNIRDLAELALWELFIRKRSPVSLDDREGIEQLLSALTIFEKLKSDLIMHITMLKRSEVAAE